MHVLVHESLAGEPAVPGRRAKESGTQSMSSDEVSVYTDVPFRKERNAVPDQGKISYTGVYLVHTGIYLQSVYPVHTLSQKYVPCTATYFRH